MNEGIISFKIDDLSFVETDSPTPAELNIVKNQDKVLFSCNYTTNIFKECGAENVFTIPLAFDKYNFHRKDKKYHDGDRIVVNIFSKFEARKAHDKIIRILTKRYGNNNRFQFNFAIYNPFFSENDNKALIARALDGKNYWNFSFLPWLPTNAHFNDYLNSGDIFIGASQGESWGLPEMHSLAIGKWGAIHNATGYKEFATKANSILFPSCGKVNAADGIFFHQGQPFNQGNFFSWDEEDFIAAFEKSVETFQKTPINSEGLKLQEQFTSKRMVSEILYHLEN